MTIPAFCRPRPLDYDSVRNTIVFTGPQFDVNHIEDRIYEKTAQEMYRKEQKRRTSRISEHLRDVNDGMVLPAGEFSFSRIDYQTPLQKTYFDNYGGVAVAMDKNYFCPHCGMEFGMAIPPEICPCCHHYTYFGEMVRDGVFNR